VLERVGKRFPNSPRVVIVPEASKALRFLARGLVTEFVLAEPLDIRVLLSHVGDALAGASGVTFPQVGPLVSRTIARVRCDYAHTSVARLADALGVSRRRLSEQFRGETGIGLREYLIRVRVEGAGYLLLETRLKLHAIAERMGLCDASHLSRLIRRRFARSPGAWRRVSSRNPAIRLPPHRETLEG
jgi:AraC-like DNA-binding protein